MLAQVDRPEEALRATEQAVEYNTELAKAFPEKFALHLSISLYSLGGRYRDLDRLEEALETTLRAVAHFRRLAEVKPEVYQFSLVAGLHSLGLNLLDLERPLQAFEVAEEALRRLLAAPLSDPLTHQELLSKVAELYRDAAEDAGAQPDSDLLLSAEAELQVSPTASDAPPPRT